MAETLKDIEARAKSREKVSIRTQLERAGLDVEPRAFWIASLGFGFALAVVIFIWMGGGAGASMAAFAALLIGTFGVPRWVLGKLVKRRQKKFLSEFANAIDVVVRGVKSGLPLNECLQIIARESPEPIAGEFR